MESTARRCVHWGITLVIAGGFVLVLLPHLIGLLAAVGWIGSGIGQAILGRVRLPGAGRADWFGRRNRKFALALPALQMRHFA